MKLPGKIKIFLWVVMWGKMLTKVNLGKRGWGVLLNACFVHLMKTFLIFSLIAQLLDIFGLFFNALSILMFNLGTVVTWEVG
jgi:hypothetical protein